MDLLDVLRRQAGRFECPNCGASMVDCGLDLIAHTESESLVKVTCTHCKDTRMIAVTVHPEADGADAVSVRDEPVPAASVISTDEVLDVRLMLEQHQGDLATLLAPPSRPS